MTMVMDGKRYESNVIHKHPDNSDRPHKGNTGINTRPPSWLVEGVEDALLELRHHFDSGDPEEVEHMRDVIVDSVHGAMKTGRSKVIMDGRSMA